MLVDREAWDIQRVRRLVYYSDWSDGQAIYRVSLDGSNPVRILMVPPSKQHCRRAIGFLCGTGRFIPCLVMVEWPFSMNDDEAENVDRLGGGWIYYANGTDGFRPYRVKPDGTGRMKNCQ